MKEEREVKQKAKTEKRVMEKKRKLDSTIKNESDRKEKKRTDEGEM